MHHIGRSPQPLLIVAWVALCGLLVHPPGHAEEASVAVAANFNDVVEALAPEFRRQSGHSIVLTAGSTGKLYAQIKLGAPFDVFLAADAERPARLEREGEGIPGTRFTYAMGVLTLWSPDAALFRDADAKVLENPRIRHVAIANPGLAPYGVAARDALIALGLWDSIAGKIVMGQNIGEAFAMVATGSAEAGLVALSSVLSPQNGQPGSRWDVPAGLHEPIRQDAVLLRRGAGNAAAVAFLEFLRQPDTRALIRTFGYGRTAGGNGG